MTGTATNGDVILDLSGNALHAELIFDFLSADPPSPQPYGFVSPIETDAASREFYSWSNAAGQGFHGTSRIRRASHAAFAVTGDFSIEAWIRPESGMYSSVPVPLVGSDDWGLEWVLVSGRQHLAGYVVDSGGATHFVYDPSFAFTDYIGTSFHVVAVRLGNALALYVNGVLRTPTTVLPALATRTSGSDFFIGHDSPLHFHQERIDEVAFYNYALSGAEVLAHYLEALNTVDVRGECNIRTSAQISGADNPDPIAYSFRHNWDQPVIERLRWRTSLFKPENGSTEFARQQSSLRRQVEYQHLLYNEKLRRQYEARSFAGRTTINQFEPDKVQVGSLALGATTATGDFTYMDFEVGHRVLVYQDDDTYEFAVLTVVGDSEVEWDTPLTRAYSNAWVKPARVARLPLEQVMDAETDTIGNASTIYEYLSEDEPLNPRRIIPFTPTLTYRGRETFDLREWQGHDYSEVPEIQYVADRSELDFDTGVVSTKQYRWGAETVTPYNMNLQGRELIAKYLGWLYERAGMYSPFWMPTFRQDLQPLSGAGSDLTVSGHEYTNLYAPADNRQDLAFVYFDGTYVMRRIEASTVDGDDDELTLDSAVPTFTNLRWLCFLRRVVLASDDLEMAWETDNVVRVAFAVRDAPLDFALGSPSVSPSPSPSTSLSTSPSHSASPSVSPSSSGSPSLSVSPSVSPSGSTSPSSSASPSV